MRASARRCWAAVSPRRIRRTRCSGMAAALGLPTVDIDITFNSITMAATVAWSRRRSRRCDWSATAPPTSPARRGDPHRRTGGGEGLSVYRAAENWPTPSRRTTLIPCRWRPWVGPGRRARSRVARRGARHRGHRVRRHRAHRPAGPPPRPVRGRAVLPAARGGHVATVSTLALFGVGALPRAPTRRWSSRRASRCCCRGCRWWAPCRMRSPGTTSPRRAGPPRSRCCPRGCSPASSWG